MVRSRAGVLLSKMSYTANMKIGILSRNIGIHSTQRLEAEALIRGHEVEVIDITQCSMNITSSAPTMHYQGSPITVFDAIIPRIGTQHTFYGSAVVRQFETMGTFSLNPSIAINRARDKLRCLQLLARKGIDLPVTGLAHSYSDIGDLIKMVGGAPLIVKLIEGTQGVGVILAETEKAAESVIQAFMGVKANIIIQEYIAESKGADIRCVVLGGKVIASMKRQAPSGDFRSNLHRGGTAEMVKITKQEREMAIRAAKILRLRFAGVDLLRSARGPLVMEVNASPGLEGIEGVTNKNIAKMVIEYIEKTAKPMTARSHYEG